MLADAIFIVPSCFNKEAQSFAYGDEFTKEVENLFMSYIKNKHVQGVNLLGGEVFHQDLDIILSLARRIKEETNKPIYCWTGFKWEDLVKDKNKVNILKYIDVIIDGQFEENKRDLTLKFKGSSNQRVIDVQNSLKQQRVVIFEN